MARFGYRVQDKRGQIMEGTLEAVSEAQAQKFLADYQYEILSLKHVKEHFTFQSLKEMVERVNAVQFNFFVRQMATLLKAGVPMLTSLLTLQEGTRDPLLKAALGSIHEDVEKGSSFSQAIGRHPRIFNTLFVSTVRSGEAIGELDTVLTRLAEILEKDYATASKIKAAMRYPMMAMAVMAVAFLAATLFIIPRFKSLFQQFGAELPLPTKILMTSSEIVMRYWYLTLLVLIATAIGLFFHYRSHNGRRFWDSALLRMYAFGVFIKYAIFSRFARMFGLMLKSGVNILQAMELIADIVGNSVISDSILRMKERVAQGDSLSNQMRHEGMYPILLVQIVHVGEESGKMDDLLLQIAEFYDAELDLMTKNIETMIEPFFIFMLAFFVTLMALGIFLPMWNMYAVIQKAAQ